MANVVYFLDEIAQIVSLFVHVWIVGRRLYVLYRRVICILLVGVVFIVFLILLILLGIFVFIFGYFFNDGFFTVWVLRLLLIFSAIPVSAPWFEPIIPARLTVGLKQ